MKAIKVMGTVDEQGKLALDSPLKIDKISRVEVIILVEKSDEIEADNLTQEEILADLQQAWQEAKNGKTIPVEQLWSD